MTSCEEIETNLKSLLQIESTSVRTIRSNQLTSSKRTNIPQSKMYDDQTFCKSEKKNFEKNSQDRFNYERDFRNRRKFQVDAFANKTEYLDEKNSFYQRRFNKIPKKEIVMLTADDVGKAVPQLDSEINTNVRSKDNNQKRYKKKQFKDKTLLEKSQAKIFRNAIISASNINSTPKNARAKLLTEPTKIIKQEDCNLFESNSSKHPEYLIEQTSKAASNCGDDSHKHMMSVKPKSHLNAKTSVDFNNTKQQIEPYDDEFIMTCNKPSCTCSYTKDILYCDLCDFHIDNERELKRHLKNPGHQVRKKDYFRVNKLCQLSSPTHCQLESINRLLEEIYCCHVQDSNDLKARTEIIDTLNSVLKYHIKECEIHLFGSSVNGFGLKNSDLNIDLVVPQGLSPSKMLLNTYAEIKNREDIYLNISKDFTAAIPKISFQDINTKLQCEITLNNELSRKTSSLFAKYAYCDERVRKLGILFRYWAKICNIDQQSLCSLPSYCFPLMVIYFLQQHQPPVVPIINDLVSSEVPLDLIDLKDHWKSQNKQSFTELWIELLKFYSIKFDYRKTVISVCQQKPLLCSDKKWTTRTMCIEDPYHTKRNIARSLANQQWCRYVIECIRSTYEYFVTGKTSSAAVSTDSLLLDDSCVGDDEEEEEEEDDDDDDIEENSVDVEKEIVDCFENQDPDLNMEDVITSISKMNIQNKKCVKKFNHLNMKEFEKTLANISNKETVVKHSNVNTSSEDTAYIDQKYTQSNSLYKFEKSEFITIKQPLYSCRQCQKVGHVKQDCPIDDNLPVMKDLKKIENSHKDLITEACEDVFRMCKPKQKEEEENINLLLGLERHIQYVFRDAKLELFGSSCNGFGFVDSDLDICLTFLNQNGKDLNQQEIIERLTQKLKAYRNIQNVLPIPTAKVPIVKFKFRNSKKDGDISLYNTLAQYNTKLLSTYCKIDSRVQKLGYALKFFAKICDICDASKGSLSSYAYILMLLFFLQQRDPPVIPVLQELNDENKPMTVREVDGWNTWFYEEIQNLPTVWDHYGKNKESVGELWIGLLCFYTEHFSVNEFVISIRQKAPLTRFEKLWNTKSIAIEDPFDHSHNLGAGVSRKMNSFIIGVFRRGREVFGLTPPHRNYIPDIIGYFFNRIKLTDNKKPPNERGCRICSKIGHKMKECPLRRRNKFKPRQFVDKRNFTLEKQDLYKNQSFNGRNADRKFSNTHQWNNTVSIPNTFSQREVHSNHNNYFQRTRLEPEVISRLRQTFFK